MTTNQVLSPTSEIDTEVVRQFADAMHQWTGVWTDPSKTYLLRQRLQPILQASGIKTHLELLAKAKFDLELRTEIIDALTTHETLFFRDHATLKMVAERLIPDRIAENPGSTFHIWSGGCSSGQEPYSLAMLLSKSTVPTIRNRVQMVATDVSAKVIERAKLGRYDKHEIQRGLSPEFFNEFVKEEDGILQLTREIRRQVDFQVASLTDPTKPAGPFDLIFCRNVLIYFQAEDVQRIVASLMDRLKPGGCVILGASEILPANPSRYQRQSINGVTVYRTA